MSIPKSEISIGDRVLTAHGKGTVLGFEDFSVDFKNSVIVEEDIGNRVAIELDSGHTWGYHNHTYYTNEILGRIHNEH